MLKERRFWVVLVLVLGILEASFYAVRSLPHRILLDTDVDTDDLSALLYLLKLNRSEFKLEGVTINTNAWSNAGHAVNQVYDILYMMGRDDVAVGMGGEGGILDDGTILPNVGGYLPIIDQGKTTIGGCRYRQTIPKGLQGRLVADTNFGIRKQFLPQGSRRYSPLRQPTAQQIIIETVSRGPISVFLIGSHTNFALFLMRNPHLKKNVEHVYVMGGAIRSRNPTGCCPKNSRGACKPRQCGTLGNLFPDYTSNPYAEFNIFADPFAAYQVLHSGVPVTLVPLDATNTIPINKKFFKTFESYQETYEAQFTFLSLKTARTWYDEQFYTSYFMWDSFTAGVAISIMRNSGKKRGKNDFAVMKYMNVTVVTSNKPYDASDGSNPFFDNRKVPKFNLNESGVHSGHVQIGLRDPFCISKKGKGKCRDGYTEETKGSDSVRVLVARKAKPNKDSRSELDKEFYVSFLKVMNRREQAGKFNFSSQFPYYKEKLYRPVLSNSQLGKPVVFDMDMSAGDFLSLLYLLKLPLEIINLKAIIVSPTGWANAATIDVVYDLLHMMGRDDIPVGLGDMFALNQSDSIFPAVGNCKYVKAIPLGSGGFLDSDTLYGLARDLPRSPRRYSAENSERRQPLALEVWDTVLKSLDPGSKITVLTNGPLTNLAKIVSSPKNATSAIQDVYVVGGLVGRNNTDKGNVFTVAANRYAEFNLFLDPLAAKTVFESEINITLIPLETQRKFSSFKIMLEMFLQTEKKTPEARFARRLLSRLYRLQRTHHRYLHMGTFLGEILGAVFLGGDHSVLKPTLNTEPVKVIAEGDESADGTILIDRVRGKHVKVLKNVDSSGYYSLFSSRLNCKKQSAVIGSFEEQRKRWNTPPDPTQNSQPDTIGI